MHSLWNFPETGFIEVEGGNIRYRIAGAASPGIPLLTLHGGPGVPHAYLESLSSLSDERPVIYYDQLGCGLSDQPDDPGLWRLDRFVNELERVIQYLDLRKVHLLGQSWGTMLAAEYLLTKGSDKAQSLIMAAPVLSVSRWNSDQREHIRSLPDSVQDVIQTCEARADFENPAYEEALMVFYKRFVCRMDPWPELLMSSFNALSLPVYHTMWGPSEFTQTGNLRHFERAEEMRRIALPTLFTCGEYDEATPTATAYYQSRMPHAERVVFKDAAHIHHLEKEAAFNRTVRDFLRRNDSRKFAAASA